MLNSSFDNKIMILKQQEEAHKQQEEARKQLEEACKQQEEAYKQLARQESMSSMSGRDCSVISESWARLWKQSTIHCSNVIWSLTLLF